MKIHNGERLHCTMCSYETYARKFLNKHIQIKHSENKPFRCNECTKTFKTKKCLQVIILSNKNLSMKILIRLSF